MPADGITGTTDAVTEALPVDAILPDLLAALEGRNSAVLVAPPGAGKTTRVPLALLDAPWCSGRILLLAPRRLAARAAAARMAEILGEEVGETVGYRIRLETKVSSATRIEVVTEGVFTRAVLDDPALEGICAVVFDEFHERSLEADLGLALALDVQGALREDLRLLVMSATIDAARVAALLGEVPVIVSEGRMFPVETVHLPRDPAARLEDEVAAAVARALAAHPGSVLAFLPGVAEIERTARALEGRLAGGIDLLPLHGGLSSGEQDRALKPAPVGHRKVVLATSIAETSLTIPDVRVVIDSGLARRPRYDPASGITRLETVKVSRASADQRRARAGRVAPGVCYRLWHEGQTAALHPFDRPEIMEADLSRFMLDLALWGVGDASALRFLDPPPRPAMAEARRLLVALGALDGKGRVTAHGRALARLPLSPRLGHMLLRAAAEGLAPEAARVAVLLGERGLGGNAVDLRERLQAFAHDRSRRAGAARDLADRLARLAGASAPTVPPPHATAGRLLAFAFPERIARARGDTGRFVLAAGRGARLDPTEVLAREPFLAVADLSGGGADARILTAAPISPVEIEEIFADRIEIRSEVRYDPAARAVRARLTRRLGALVLSSEGRPGVEPEEIAQALAAAVREHGLGLLPAMAGLAPLRARLAFLRGLEGESWPALDDAALMQDLDWLLPALRGRSHPDDVAERDLEHALLARLDWSQRERLDRLAPTHFDTPAGTRRPIDYGGEGGPTVEVRVQELLGLDRHPCVAEGRVPLVLALTSPAGRPVQVTRDLPGFWRGSWRSVRAEMRGRYPKHDWPEDPLSAAPTSGAKRRGG